MEKDSLRRWLEGAMSEEERKAFENSKDFEYLLKILRSSKYFKAPDYDVEGELKRFKETQEKSTKVVKMNVFQMAVRVAAAALVFFSIWWIFLRENPTIIQTAAGEKSELILPDSSEVIINAVTSLSYNEKQWEKDRTIELEGEAFFKVTDGKRFDVQTPSGVVTVLGTQFNVKQRGSFFEVMCFEGMVQVESKGTMVKLFPSKMFRLMNNKIDPVEDFAWTTPGWISNESLFQSITYAEVIRELERQYNVHVNLKNIDQKQLFSGGFTHNDLNSALQSITLPLNISYEIKDDQHIVLTGEME